ncbi:uncharacterized protein G2W53_022051 [Senna tora]|uniref:DUF4283 domain-containing protein n=1 Tax=Senna tora TaxID=362788 RepID=A0A834TM16_9FABA|nr:uncharacterized protein G2W53_022051 [Senna tora]
MEEMQETLAFQNIPQPEPRPTSAPVVSLEPEFVQLNRSFWEKCLIGLLIDSMKFKVSRMQSIIDHLCYLHGPTRVVGRVKRYYVIHFEVHEDRQQILNEGPWAMQGEKIGSLMGEVGEIDWAPTFPRNIRFAEDCDRSREHVDMSLDAQRQWVQDHYGNAYGTMINQAYFVPKARIFRPHRADPVDFYFEPWVPMDTHGNMDPPTQVEIDDTEE